MTARLLAHEGIRKLLMLDLIRHDVTDDNQEWFARCCVNHTQAFPLALYDLTRATVVATLACLFMQAIVPALFLAAGMALAATQFHLDRHCKTSHDGFVAKMQRLRAIGVARAIVWNAMIGTCLVFTPADLRMPFTLIAMLTFTVDILGFIPFPRIGIAAATLQSATIAGTLFWAGGMANMIGAAVALWGLIYAHWALFNLNYMFATRRLRTKVLREANETVNLLLNQYDEDGSDWLIECDSEGKIVSPSERFCKVAKREAHELAGLFIADLFIPSSDVEKLVKMAFAGEAVRNFMLPLEIEGVRAWWSLNSRPIHNRDGKIMGWRGFISDVTKTRVAEEKVTYMAHYDVLTNLPNRSLFNTTLKRAFTRREDHQMLAVLYVDLDHFKDVNDTYGHSRGDEVLSEAGHRIETAVPSHNIVARLGGDEFAVLLDDITNRKEALAVAEAIVSAMDEPVMINGQKFSIGASVGVAFAPDNGLTGAEVLRAADLALYDAKARGRHGASLFDPAMQKQVLERRELELDLRAALTRGELQLHYQPLLDTNTSEIAGYEALLRWNHPARGMIPPDTFIPIAEDIGHIVPIGAWVLREALMEAATWPEHLSVSVNLSPAQMKDAGLINTIVSALASSRVSPGRLELEITETFLMQDSEENLALLHQIRALGVRIALDDFGTGYSSLNYLRSFPFDKIKIDHCFVSNLSNSKDNQAIIKAVVELAGKLNMRTTAEGVETEKQLAELRGNGCDQVQGFLFSKARPSSELEHRYDRPDAGAKTCSPISLDEKRRTRAASKAVGKPRRKRG